MEMQVKLVSAHAQRNGPLNFTIQAEGHKLRVEAERGLMAETLWKSGGWSPQT